MLNVKKLRNSIKMMDAEGNTGIGAYTVAKKMMEENGISFSQIIEAADNNIPVEEHKEALQKIQELKTANENYAAAEKIYKAKIKTLSFVQDFGNHEWLKNTKTILGVASGSTILQTVTTGFFYPIAAVATTALVLPYLMAKGITYLCGTGSFKGFNPKRIFTNDYNTAGDWSIGLGIAATLGTCILSGNRFSNDKEDFVSMAYDATREITWHQPKKAISAFLSDEAPTYKLVEKKLPAKAVTDITNKKQVANIQDTLAKQVDSTQHLVIQ